MELKNLTFLEILTKIQKSSTLEELAKIEEQIQIESTRRKEVATNWIEKKDAGVLAKQCGELCSRRRRHLLSIPKFQKEKVEYDLGRAIGKKI